MKRQISRFPQTAAAGTLSAALVFLLTGCANTCIVTEYDRDGKILKTIRTKENLSKTISSGLKNKSVLIIRSGWCAKIQATPAEMTNGGAANVEISIGTRHAAYSSIPVTAEASAEIAKSHENAIASVLQTNISAASSGISGSSGGESTPRIK